MYLIINKLANIFKNIDKFICIVLIKVLPLTRN